MPPYSALIPQYVARKRLGSAIEKVRSKLNLPLEFGVATPFGADIENGNFSYMSRTRVFLRKVLVRESNIPINSAERNRGKKLKNT